MATLTGYSPVTSINIASIKDRTYDCYLGTGVQNATVTFKVSGGADGASVKFIDGGGTELLTQSATVDNATVNVPGNLLRVLLNKAAGNRPLIQIVRFDAVQTTTGAVPEPVTSGGALSVKSFPLTANEPVLLPAEASQQRFYYLTLDHARNRNFELLCTGGPCKIYVSDEEHGFVLSEGGDPLATGDSMAFNTAVANPQHQQLLITVVAESATSPETLVFSANEKVQVLNLAAWFQGTPRQFHSTEQHMKDSLHDILERTSANLYSITKGHVRLGRLDVAIGTHRPRGFKQDLDIDPNGPPALPEALTGPNHTIHCNRAWWQMDPAAAARTLTHEFFHHAFSLPDEYTEGWPSVTGAGVQRGDSVVTCGSSIMGKTQVFELCVAATHGTIPGRRDAHTSMWELLAPQLGVDAPTRSTTELFRSPFEVRLPVELH